MTFPPLSLNGSSNRDGSALAEFLSTSQALGLDLRGLNPLSQLQWVLANLQTGLPPLSSFGIFNVQDPRYGGAKGDGATDDTEAIQNTIEAAEAQGNAMVFFPSPGDGLFYKTTSALVISEPVWLVGSHPNVAIKGYGLSGSYLIDIDLNVLDNVQFIGFEKLTLLTDSTGGDLVRLNNASNVTFRDVNIGHARHGIVIGGTSTFGLRFERLNCTEAMTANAVYYKDYTGGGQHTFDECSLSAATGILVDSASSVNEVTLVNTNFESNTVNGIGVTGTVDGWTMLGCRAENNGGNNSFVFVPSGAGNKVKGLCVQGGFFSAGASEVSTFVLGGDTGVVRGFSIQGTRSTDYDGQLVNLNGDGQSGIIAGNQIGTTALVVNALRPGVACFNNENDSGSVGGLFAPPLTIPTLTGASTLADVIAVLEGASLAL